MNDSIALILSDLGEAVTALLSESIKGGLAGKARLRNGTVTWAGVLGPSGNSDYNCKAGGATGSKDSGYSEGILPDSPRSASCAFPRRGLYAALSVAGYRVAWYSILLVSLGAAAKKDE